MGIIQQAPQEQPWMQQGMPMQQPGAQGSQDDYDKTMAAASKAIYNPEVMKGILEAIKTAQNPAQGLLQAASLVMRQLNEISGGKMPAAVKVPAFKEVLTLIAELAEKAGVIPDAAQALQQAMQMVDQKGGPQGNFKPFMEAQ